MPHGKTHTPNLFSDAGRTSPPDAGGVEQATGMELSLADYIFVLPKLIWPKPPGKARWKTRVKNINERMALPQQGKWKTLLDLSMKLPLPTYEPTPEEELLDEHGLWQEMARKLHAAACQGQVPPPSKITKDVWQEAKNKLKPHSDAPPPSVDAKSWHPTVEQCSTVIYELKHHKAPDVGGWTTESAKAVFLLPHLPVLWTAWLTRIAQLHPDTCQARTWHARKLVCLKKPQGGHRPILISSVWIKLISRLLLKEAGAPPKQLVQNVQFGVRVPHKGLALLTKVRSHLHQSPTHVAAQLDFQNAFGAMHRKACIEQLEKHINPQEPWFLATKNLWSRSVAIPQDLEEEIFQMADGVPQGDPLSTLVFATAMTLLMLDIIRSKAPNVALVAYVDDTVLLGEAPDVTQAITEIQAEAATGGLKLQKAKTQVWSPTDASIENEPLLRTLQGRMGDKRGILILGEAVSEEPEDALPVGNEAFVTEQIESIKQKLLDDLKKLEHLPHKLVKGEEGLQTAWGRLKDAWMYADHFVPQLNLLKHCWLRNVNKHTLKAGQVAIHASHSSIHQSGEWTI